MTWPDADVLQGPQEHVLRDVLGVLVVPDHSVDQVEHPVLVAIEQQFKGGRVAILASTDQLSVVGMARSRRFETQALRSGSRAHAQIGCTFRTQVAVAAGRQVLIGLVRPGSSARIAVGGTGRTLPCGIFFDA